MITGVSETWNDFPNPHRIEVDSCRPGCFNDPSLPIDRKWDWCPRGKNYVCTGEITESMVIEQIEKIVMGASYAGKNIKEKERKISGKHTKHGAQQGDDYSKSEVTGTPA